MVRYAFRMRVREGKLEEYIAHHAAVWPDLLADMQAAGITNFSIYHDGLDLFASLESDDIAASNARMAASDPDRRWQTLMGDFLEDGVGEDGGRSRPMPEIFRMD